MFDLLQHPPASPEQTRLGAAVSIVVHAALVISLALGTGGAVRPRDAGEQSIIVTAIRFLLPPDRKGAPPSEERVQWTAQRIGVPQGDDVAVFDEAPVPKPAGGQAPEDAEGKAPMPLTEAARAQDAFTLLDVDSAAARDPESAAPKYPEFLEAQGIEGTAVVRFVVDSTGYADIASFQLIETNHALFGASVRAALPGMKFVPARIGTRKVRQLVELPFVFRIVRRVEPAPVVKKKP